MNPLDERLLEMLAMFLPQPSEAMTEKVVKNMEFRVTTFVEKFKEKMEGKTSLESMQAAANCVRAFDEGKADISIQTTLSIFFTQALWACLQNKTMPEAMQVYGDMLRAQAKGIAEEMKK